MTWHTQTIQEEGIILDTHLNGLNWFHAVTNGARNLCRYHEHLNKINVFPVSDGDTGTNLVSMMKSIIQNAKPSEHFRDTSKSIAHASLMGARGNSGTIFSQFFYGLCTSSSNAEISMDEFCDLSQKASTASRKAVENPVEGTILTVMQAWSGACANLKGSSSFSSLMEDSVQVAQKSLSATTEKLAPLKKAKVVDAGAQGFVYFLEGVLAYLKDPKKHQSSNDPIIEDPSEPEHAHDIDTKPIHRYCTEALIKSLTVSLDDLRYQVRHLGDSMVCAGDQSLCRLHIHTNTPAKVMETIDRIADIDEQKVEDMLRQFEMGQADRPSIALVIDSSCDIPQELIDKHHIHVLPISLSVDGTPYLDRLTIEDNQIYDALLHSNKSLTTATPSPLMVEKTLAMIAQHYEQTLVVALSSANSGVCQLIKMTAEKVSPNITVYDSCKAAASHGLMALEAAKMIKQDKSMDEIITHLDSIKDKTQIYVAVKDMQYMARSGRVSNLKASLLKRLRLHPIISLQADGKATVIGARFGFKSALKAISKLAAKQSPKSYAIVHAAVPQEAEKFSHAFSTKLRFSPEFVMPISSAVGVHAGPGCIAIATRAK